MFSGFFLLLLGSSLTRSWRHFLLFAPFCPYARDWKPWLWYLTAHRCAKSFAGPNMPDLQATIEI